MTTFILTDYNSLAPNRGTFPLLGSKKMLTKRTLPQPIMSNNMPEDFQPCTYVLEDGFVKCNPYKETGKVTFTNISTGTIKDNAEHFEALRASYNIWKEKHQGWRPPTPVLLEKTIEFVGRPPSRNISMFAVKVNDSVLAGGNLVFHTIANKWLHVNQSLLLSSDGSVWHAQPVKGKPSKFLMEFDGKAFFGKPKI